MLGEAPSNLNGNDSALLLKNVPDFVGQIIDFFFSAQLGDIEHAIDSRDIFNAGFPLSSFAGFLVWGLRGRLFLFFLFPFPIGTEAL